MLSVKGKFQNGVALPDQNVEGREGRPVIITFVDDSDQAVEPVGGETGYAALNRLIEECQVDSGLTDLAHQHDHYLYSTPKQP
jgi:hypothetical protein